MIAETQMDAIQADPGRALSPQICQQAFRHILKTISYPARVETVGAAITPPSGIAMATAALLTLVDQDVDLRFSDNLAAHLEPWLRFHCGCRIVTGDRLDAAFAVVARGEAIPPLDTMLGDDPARPDISTTLILECEALRGGEPLRASGPGIKGSEIISPRGVPQTFWAARSALRPLFPLGIDLFLTSGAELLALPRTILIEEAV